MISDNTEEKICTSHILIPTFNTKKIKEEKIHTFATEIAKKINEDPSFFGVAAYNYSFCPSGSSNTALNICINNIKANNEKKYKEELYQCITKYGGDLGCYSKEELDATYVEAASKLKVGEITKEPIKTKFGYHIIKRNK